jgi:hypothetical protein
MTKLWMTQRKRVLATYEEAGQPFTATTQPYHSCASLKFDITCDDSTNGIAFAIAQKGQRLVFFNYGVGDRIILGADQNHVATEADTNLSKGGSTNGANDYVIETIGMHCRAHRVTYPEDLFTCADERTKQALLGIRPIGDPGGIIVPPQVQSPFNLEQGLFHWVQPFLSVQLQFDRGRFEPIGTCDVFPQGGAQSYLRTNGEPSFRNRYTIPEGYLWRRDGEPDSDFKVPVILEEDVVVPLNLITPWDDDQAPGALPDRIDLDLVMRVGGLEVGLPSQN